MSTPLERLDESRLLRPGDFIEFPRFGGSLGVWEVRSVLLGALTEESVYGIRVVDLIDPRDDWHVPITTMYVPTVFLDRLPGWTVRRRGQVTEARGG